MYTVTTNDVNYNTLILAKFCNFAIMLSQPYVGVYQQLYIHIHIHSGRVHVSHCSWFSRLQYSI